MRMAFRGSALLGVLAAAAFAAISTPAFAGNFSFTVVTPGLAVSAGQSGVALGVAQPGFYGVVSLGDLPAPPPVIYARPVIIDAVPGDDDEPPIYLHVPPGYARHWAEHCAVYRACGRRVYFVRDDWYRNVYVPRYRPAYVREHEQEREHERDHDRYRQREDSRRDDRDHRDVRGRDDRGYDRGPHRGSRDHGGRDGHGHGDD